MAKTLQDFRDEYAEGLAQDAKHREAKIKVNGAKGYIRANLDELDGDMKEAVLAVVGDGQRGGGGGATRTNPVKACIATLVDKGEMSDVECFMEFKKGPAEMRELMKYAVRNMPEDERVWIKFQDDTYMVVEVGAEEPEDWDGYRPVTTEMEI